MKLFPNPQERKRFFLTLLYTFIFINILGLLGVTILVAWIFLVIWSIVMGFWIAAAPKDIVIKTKKHWWS